MSLFRKPPSRPAPAPRVFDGWEGRGEADRLATVFLKQAARNDVEAVASISQSIMSATPNDPGARVGMDFFTAPWAWLAAVAHRAESDENFQFAGRIGMMTEIWNRVILTNDPSIQMGRLVSAPLQLEAQIYGTALRCLTQLDPATPLVPDDAGNGWTASEAFNQLCATIETIASKGEPIDASVVALARGGARFAPPQPSTTGPESGDFSRALDAMTTNVTAARAGDRAADLWSRATYLIMNNGDQREALHMFEEAGALGHVRSLYDGGCLARELGEMERALLLWRAGSDAGDVDSAWNLAVAYYTDGRSQLAADTYLRAAQLGDARGFGALASMALEGNDTETARQWAKLGADAGEPWCMLRHGIELINNAQGNRAALVEARDLLERAAQLGQIDAMSMAANVNSMLGDESRSRRYVDMVVQTGNTDAIERLRRHGFL